MRISTSKDAYNKIEFNKLNMIRIKRNYQYVKTKIIIDKEKLPNERTIKSRICFFMLQNK